MNSIKALDIAKYLIELAAKIDENDLTNLKLQKLLYFAQGKYLANKNTPLFGDQIEAWDFGPVVKNVYDTFKTCGAFPITTFDVKFDAQELPSDVKTFLDQIWEDYGKYSANYLVSLTHKSNTPWYKSYNSNGDKVISTDSMLAFFRNATRQ